MSGGRAGHFKFLKESAQKYMENLVTCFFAFYAAKSRGMTDLTAVLLIPTLLWFRTFYVICHMS